MQALSDGRKRQKCGAHSRTTKKPCENYSMPNGRCRMHGGKSTGAPIKSGMYTKQIKQERKEVSELIKSLSTITSEYL